MREAEAKLYHIRETLKPKRENISSKVVAAVKDFRTLV